VDFAFYTLPFNEDDNYQDSLLTKWFNIQEDEPVLIEDSFWNLIGGEGIYSIMKEVVFIGNNYKQRIYEEFL
jgi:hypothetical protein